LIHSYHFSPSRLFSFFLIETFILAIFIIFILPFTIIVKLGLAVILLGALFYFWSRDALLILPSSYVALRIEGDLVTLSTRGRHELKGVVAHDSVVMAALTILNVEQGKGKKVLSIVIFPDSLEAEKYRELRVLLKWGYRKVL
jgi:toxin CptA